MYVSSAIKSAPCLESARDVPCQLMDSGTMFLAGYRSPSCLVAEERDVLRQFSAGQYAFFNIIDRPFHYRSLAYLIRAMPVKGVGGRELRGCRSPSCPAAEERASFFPAGRDAILIISFWNFRLRKIFIRCRQTFELNSIDSNQPPLLPVQIVQNWQGTDSLACDKQGTCPKCRHSDSIILLES